MDTDTHILLDQPLLRLPHELLRKNLKIGQRQIEMTNKAITTALQATSTLSPTETLAALDATLAKAQTLKRKLEALHAEEQSLHRQQRARLQHLQALHEIPTLADVKYEQWSHVRLDRLLVDYLLRQGYVQSARELAQATEIEDLVDVGVFEECSRIERSLCEGRTKECLSWCADNKQALKKSGSNLELELRLQEFIEMARTADMGQLMEAILHARKHLAGGQDAEFGLRAAGLLAHPPDTLVEPYRDLYSTDRYTYLASRYIDTHHELFSLPTQPLLHIALSAGLSALKTPSCHSVHAAQPNTLTGAPVCPICSTELNELARNVPYAHHTKSHMEDDPVVLPNGRVFGRERLKMLNEKMATPKGKIRDPTDPTGMQWEEEEIKKVFIS